jgi:hypothetical protein
VGLVLALACAAAPRAAAEWFVVCDVATGAVVLGESGAGQGREVLAGPFPGERTARIWVEESCPGLRCARGRGCVAVAAPTPTPSPAGWIAVCDPATGRIAVARETIPSGKVVLRVPGGGSASHASEPVARAWVDYHCPSWRCGSRGDCATAGAIAPPASPGGGWVAGEVTSVMLGPAEAAAASPAGAAGPAGPDGPAPADLGPLIATAKAAAAGCSFEAALRAAEQMARFDPEDPWLVANLPKLRLLAERQRTTEATVWQASSALSAGDLKRARKLAGTAANNAVSCQYQAVAELVRGIDAAIASDRAARDAANRRAAAALLPGLVDLSRTLSGGAAGKPATRPGSVPPPSVSRPAASVAGPDPCAFKYTYESAWSVEPICSCPGYRFDARQFKCVR